MWLKLNFTDKWLLNAVYSHVIGVCYWIWFPVFVDWSEEDAPRETVQEAAEVGLHGSHTATEGTDSNHSLDNYKSYNMYYEMKTMRYSK